MKKSLLEAAHETIKDFHEVGVVDALTMKQFDYLCLQPVKKKDPREFKPSMPSSKPDKFKKPKFH